MKKLCLLIALVASPVFAQEEEQEVQIEIETDGSPAVSQNIFDDANEFVSSTVGMPDGSVWYSVFDRSVSEARIVYCHVNEDGNPRCEEVDIDD
jgi:hypothetical protein